MRSEIDRVNRENEREADRVNRENQRRVAGYNRQVEQHKKKVVDNYDHHVEKVNAHNTAVIADLNRQWRISSSGPRYTADEQR